jgi:hypothetical protein
VVKVDTMNTVVKEAKVEKVEVKAKLNQVGRY